MTDAGPVSRIHRRDFLKRAGAGAGALALGCAPGTRATAGGGVAPAVVSGAPDVAVIGAGAFGGWTALYLQRLGARVVLIDMYGPGNSRSTSGGETRGVRSSYGERRTWVRWANEAMRRWREWDIEQDLTEPLFYTTGDVILRSDPADSMIRPVALAWDELGVPYERLSPEEVRYRWPVIDVSEFTVALYEPSAGVVRARRACQSVADAFEREGGELRVARAELAPAVASSNTRVLVDGEPLSAGQYVFACGPWLQKVVPDIMANRLRLPLGHVFYYATPPGDRRWEWPNLPSYNVPSCTGWPALPPDNRGFRVRTGGREPGDPDTSDRWIPLEFHERPRDILRKYFPELASAVVSETRACHYESASGDSFIIDQHPDHPDVWIAGGGSAEAFKQGPMLGEYIARRVLGRDTQPELAEEFRIPEQTYEVVPGG